MPRAVAQALPVLGERALSLAEHSTCGFLTRGSPVVTGLFANAASELAHLRTPRLALAFASNVSGHILQVGFSNLSFLPTLALCSWLLPLSYTSACSTSSRSRPCCSWGGHRRPGNDPQKWGVCNYRDFGRSEAASPAECHWMCLGADGQGKSARC